MSEESVDVPEKLSVRLDPQTREQIRLVMKESGMTCSQAVRVLLALGAEREGQLTQAFKSAAFREGTMEAVARVRQSFEKSVADALKGLADYTPR